MINFAPGSFATSGWKRRFSCLRSSGCAAGNRFPSPPSSGSTMEPWTPTAAIVATMRDILADHNALEEGPAGLYEICDDLAGSEAESLLAKLRAAPEVTVMQHSDSPAVMNVLRRTLERAGYRLRGAEGGKTNG